MEAKQALDVFIKKRFKLFGDYQDAIETEHSIIYHSFMSSSINSGLLTPNFIMKQVLKYQPPKLPMNSFEGYIRQLVGWREYMRFLYVAYYKNIVFSNHFKNSRKLNWKLWYEADTGIHPLDNEISKANELGYSHHIVRLMMFLNVMVMSGVRAEDVVKWFSEIVCMDAYPWVMVSNIYCMGWYYPDAMRKPYLSTSRYITKMSNYEKDCSWTDTWDSLFYAFLHKNKKNLTGMSKIYLRNLKYFEMLSGAKQKQILLTAQKFIEKTTNP
jgi:deoxyribodipyrimidine photolyase-related protein